MIITIMLGGVRHEGSPQPLNRSVSHRDTIGSGRSPQGDGRVSGLLMRCRLDSRQLRNGHYGLVSQSDTWRWHGRRKCAESDVGTVKERGHDEVCVKFAGMENVIAHMFAGSIRVCLEEACVAHRGVETVVVCVDVASMRTQGSLGAAWALVLVHTGYGR